MEKDANESKRSKRNSKWVKSGVSAYFCSVLHSKKFNDEHIIVEIEAWLNQSKEEECGRLVRTREGVTAGKAKERRTRNEKKEKRDRGRTEKEQQTS